MQVNASPGLALSGGASVTGAATSQVRVPTNGSSTVTPCRVWVPVFRLTMVNRMTSPAAAGWPGSVWFSAVLLTVSAGAATASTRACTTGEDTSSPAKDDRAKALLMTKPLVAPGRSASTSACVTV